MNYSSQIVPHTIPLPLLNNTKRYVILAIIGLIGFGLRLWLLDQRWINPDEGAHLMDAVLVNEGKIPLVDFSSRQPVYTYIIAGVFRVIGPSLSSGRVMNLWLSLAVGFLVYLIANQLFNKPTAFLSAVIYWAIPLEIVNSVIVKTQPLTIFFTCFSFFALIKYLKTQYLWWIIAAGILAALGYYVRQSALFVPVVIIFFLLLSGHKQVLDRIKSVGYFVLGYFGFVALVMGYYVRFMDLTDVINSGLNPFDFIMRSLKKLIILSQTDSSTTSIIANKTQEIMSSKYKLYDRYIRSAFTMHSFLFVGAGFSLISFWRKISLRRFRSMGDEIRSYVLLYLWVGALILAYLYYYHTRGFFIDYFREFIPPLAILFSAWVCNTLEKLKTESIEIRFSVLLISLASVLFIILKTTDGQRITTEYIIISLSIFTGIYFIVWQNYSNKIRYIIPLIVGFSVCVGFLLLMTDHRAYKIFTIVLILMSPLILIIKGVNLSYEEYFHYFMLMIVMASFLYSYAYSTRYLGIMYDSVWSPKALSDVALYLKKNTRKTDRIISGAVIWELAAQRKPYLNITHPLALEFPIPEDERKLLETAMLDKPPKIVILDSYTEKTYLRQVPSFKALLNLDYNLVYTALPARVPVKIYQYRDDK